MIKPFNIEELPENNTGRCGAANKDIMGFVESRLSCAEVIFDKGKKCENVNAAYAIAAKRLGAPVKVIQRSKRLFLIREDNNA